MSDLETFFNGEERNALHDEHAFRALVIHRLKQLEAEQQELRALRLDFERFQSETRAMGKMVAVIAGIVSLAISGASVIVQAMTR